MCMIVGDPRCSECGHLWGVETADGCVERDQHGNPCGCRAVWKAFLGQQTTAYEKSEGLPKN